ncbi:hypothetical protein [Sedimentisphaera salicampi]|uniref:hypothetical protein n=1 Tax=Sedimentisphaera salicampi TaxID=1941349 RepID=UPI000B9AED17|nr:hypothetical protein [Sedimentisphaera salicampi]OXU16110.1 hypothetical protein SMSP1_00279 [Sedimentisphaera salicampi]
MKSKTVKLSTFISFALMSIVLISGCDKESDSSKEILQMIKNTKPVKAASEDGGLRELSLYEALKTHQEHEHSSHHHEDDNHYHHEYKAHQHDELTHFCLGIATGFKAIQFADAQLSPNSRLNPKELEISVNGAMEGVWDIFSIYAGSKREFEGTDKPMSSSSFTFTAKTPDAAQELKFRLKKTIIPEKFFKLKNKGYGCGNKELGEAKNKALRKILSSSAQECFELVNNTSD